MVYNASRLAGVVCYLSGLVLLVKSILVIFLYFRSFRLFLLSS